MDLVYAVIKGETNLERYCEKRWKQKPRFVESFAHNIDGVLIERIYAKSPDDDGYSQYSILIMKSNKDTGFCDPGDIRRKVYEDIRTGRISLLKVR